MIIEKAIDALSSIVNVSTGMAHPIDEARAKELFKALHKKGINLNRDEIETLAKEHSWPDRHAKSLGELAERIGNGGRVQIKHPRYWGEPTVEKILNEIHEESDNGN